MQADLGRTVLLVALLNLAYFGVEFAREEHKDGLGAIVPGYESDMPAFGTVLTDAEIPAVLEYIKSTWPERQKAYQQARSE
jgi:mono/diheme cytochrome c family protein